MKEYKISYSRINQILLFLSAFFVLLKMWSRIDGGGWIYSYANSYTYEFDGGVWYRRSTLYAQYCLIAFFLINASRCILRKRDTIWVALCVCSFLGWTVMEAVNGNAYEAVFGNISTLTCLIPLFFLYSNAPGVKESIKRLSGLLTLGYLGMCVYTSIDMYTKLGFGIGVLNSPAKDSLSLAVVALWVFVFTEYSYSHEKAETIIRIVLVTVATICSVAILSRSWTIQCFLLLCGFLLEGSRKQNNFGKMIKVCIVIGVVLMVLSFGFENLLDSLLLRANEDTRSGQFEQFFSQVSVASLVFGKGISATYLFNGAKYQYFDNQLIYTAFHFGVLCFLPIIAFVMRVQMVPANRNVVTANRYKLVGIKISSVLFLAALLGLSVYLKYEFSISFAVFLMFIGQADKHNLEEIS